MIKTIQTIATIKGAQRPLNLIYLENNGTIIVNYLFASYYKSSQSSGVYRICTKVLLNNGETFDLEGDLYNLQVADNKLFSVKGDAAEKRVLQIFDLERREVIKEIPLRYNYGYGNSCLIKENLYIAFVAPDGGDASLMAVDTKKCEIIANLHPGETQRILLSNSSKNQLLVSGKIEQGKWAIFDIDTLKNEVRNSYGVSFSPIQGAISGTNLLISDLKELKVVEYKTMKLMSSRKIGRISDLVPLDDGNLILMLLRGEPNKKKERLVLYDFQKDKFVYEHQIKKEGLFLKGFKNGKILYAEVIEGGGPNLQGTLEVKEVVI